MGSPFQIPPSNRPLALANNRIAHSANRHPPLYRNQPADYGLCGHTGSRFLWRHIKGRSRGAAKYRGI